MRTLKPPASLPSRQTQPSPSNSARPRRSPGQLGSKNGFYLELNVHRLLPSLRGEAGEFVIVTVPVVTTATDVQLWKYTFASVQQMIVQQFYASTPVDLPFLLHTKLIPIFSSAWPAWPL
jgi:hypothetical protein